MLLRTASRMGHGIVCVQAFVMRDAYVESSDVRIAFERLLDPARGVFAEHEVAAVGEREGLFIFPLHGGLHGGAQRLFDTIEQYDER